MSFIDFECLITLIGPKIAKMDTKFRKAILVQERLTVTLKYLAIEDLYSSLQYLLLVSIAGIVQFSQKKLIVSQKGLCVLYQFFNL